MPLIHTFFQKLASSEIACKKAFKKIKVRSIPPLRVAVEITRGWTTSRTVGGGTGGGLAGQVLVYPPIVWGAHLGLIQGLEQFRNLPESAAGFQHLGLEDFDGVPRASSQEVTGQT